MSKHITQEAAHDMLYALEAIEKARHSGLSNHYKSLARSAIAKASAVSTEGTAAGDAPDTELLGALEKIALREGAYSRDPLIHAGNCIADMVRIAEDAIAKAKGEQS